jgi:putative peptide zinc metalloprotease protein
MLQLRPTFSESWYRVVSLKPKLRGTAQISRQYYRGERWYVVRDAASNQFHRLSDAAYRFVGLLDGSRTVGEAWDLVGGTLADDAPTQPEVIQILSQLYAANLVETDIPPDATVLLRRHKKQMQRKMQGRLMNILFPRIPVWDPDRFLLRWMPLAKVGLSRLGAAIWLLVVISAILALTPHWNDLRAAASEAINIRNHPVNAFYLWGVFVLIKFIHECGHAFACRRFGGECHEMGIMFLVFVPTPYVDASTAWAFPNKWARMFVGAAGMIVELFVAALCAFFWLYTKDSGSVATQLAYNTMLIASVSTVMFNANPLLRYDGYYMLSDYLEIPNLQMRSREYLFGLIKRHVFRIKPQQPLPPAGQRAQLFFYGIASSIYRIFVGIMIILIVTWQVPILGVLMGIGGVVTWVVVPLVKLFKYLTIDPELHRKRGRAWAFSAGVAAAAVLLIGVIRFPRYIYASGIAEPEQREVLRATSPGWIREVRVHDGDKVLNGDVVMVLEDPALEQERQSRVAEIEQIKVQLQQASVSDPVLKQIAEKRLESTQRSLAMLEEKIADLTIKAPFDGYMVAPDLRNTVGRYAERGAELATIATNNSLLIKANIEQNDSVQALAAIKDLTEVRLVGQPETVLHIRTDTFKLSPAAVNHLAHARTGTTGGGDIPVDPRDPSGTKPLVNQFEFRAVISNDDLTYQAGQGAYVRLKLASEPLYIRWSQRFLQLLTNNANSKWL